MIHIPAPVIAPHERPPSKYRSLVLASLSPAPFPFRFPPSPICLLSPVFCLLSSVFCLLSSVFCLLSPVFCLLSSVVCLLSSGSGLLSSVFFRLAPVFCLLSSVFCLLSSVFCLLSSVSCLLSSRPSPTSTDGYPSRRYPQTPGTTADRSRHWATPPADPTASPTVGAPASCARTRHWRPRPDSGPTPNRCCRASDCR